MAQYLIDQIEVAAEGPSKTVKLGDGSELNCHALLIASGVSYRNLEAKGIEGLTGAGVYYGAAMTEGESVRGEDRNFGKITIVLAHDFESVFELVIQDLQRVLDAVVDIDVLHRRLVHMRVGFHSIHEI